MADIDVVKGRSSNWIWWVIAAIALVMLLIFVMRGNRADTPSSAPRTAIDPATTSAVLEV